MNKAGGSTWHDTATVNAGRTRSDEAAASAEGASGADVAKGPNFFIAGAPKSGTTALAKWLAEHPNVLMAEPKEPWFFSKVHRSVCADMTDYLNLFASAGPQHRVVGEASPTYMEEGVMTDALAAFPGARVLVILRNPVDMAPSLHGQNLTNEIEPYAQFDRAWSECRTADGGRRGRRGYRLDYLSRCCVGRQLADLRETVPERDLAVMFYDDLVADPGSFYQGVLHFLNLPDDGRRDFGAENVGRRVRNQSVYRLFALARRAVGGLKRVTGLRGYGPGLLTWLRDRNLASGRPSLSDDTQADLIAHFRAEVRSVEAQTGRDLAHWLR